MFFVFDLDGTLTTAETLPVIARLFGIEEEIDALTSSTVRGDVPFIESFLRRVNILGRYDSKEISGALASLEVFPAVQQFIINNKEICAIATGNLDVWVEQLALRFECELFSSEGEKDEAGVIRLKKILKKEDVVRALQSQGESVVFVGDGNNDAEAMRLADVSIAVGLVHEPAVSVVQVADYVVYDESALTRLLKQLQQPQPGKSVVISAAGTGSRLGMGQTKSLVPLEGHSIIQIQLALLSGEEDIRIVVGFQASELIREVLAFRKDVVFVLNHDYFHTKTAASFSLGARQANEWVIGWDGDLLVHPDDIASCLQAGSAWLGISEAKTDDAVLVKLDSDENVDQFGHDDGKYEWSGPFCIKRDAIEYGEGNVYGLLEPFLPLPAKIIRAMDIDTFDDYERALNFVRSWPGGNYKASFYYSEMASRIASPTDTRNKAPDFTNYDVAFIRSYADSKASWLDLGSGTGLSLNPLLEFFGDVVAVEKYPEFSRFIQARENLTLITSDLLTLQLKTNFDLVTVFGVMNFFSDAEAVSLYRKIAGWVKPHGKLLVKHQMGIDGDVEVDAYSDELGSNYFSHYRGLKKEQRMLEEAGFSVTNVFDIYPKEFNRWDSTHFYAIECSTSGLYH